MAGNKCTNATQQWAVLAERKPALCKMLIVEPLDEFYKELRGFARRRDRNAHVKVLARVGHLHEQLNLDLIWIELSRIEFSYCFCRQVRQHSVQLRWVYKSDG
ncbi:unannotated protein [freshwater metagenome]|uniref:Unannotated protein n=1 Tax=freshwater metagenome TaxID=449393 RepID=A0A6J7RTX6_9ZZZZ